MPIDVKSWKIIFDSDLEILESWDSEMILIRNKNYLFENRSYNGYIPSGQTFKIRGKCVTGENKLKNLIITFEK